MKGQVIIRQENILGCFYRLLLNNKNELVFRENDIDNQSGVIVRLTIGELKKYLGLSFSKKDLLTKLREMSTLNFLHLCSFIRIYPTPIFEFQNILHNILK